MSSAFLFFEVLQTQICCLLFFLQKKKADDKLSSAKLQRKEKQTTNLPLQSFKLCFV